MGTGSIRRLRPSTSAICRSSVSYVSDSPFTSSNVCPAYPSPDTAAATTRTTSSTEMACVCRWVHSGRTIHGSRSTSVLRISNDEPPGPTIIPARSSVTGMPVDLSTSPTSSRLCRWGLTCPVGTRPPR